MAKICVVCGSLCAYFLLFLTITSVYSQNDYYKTDNNENKIPVVIDFIEGHRLHRRDVENNQSNSESFANSSNTATPVQNRTAAPIPQSPVNKTDADNKTTKTKISKTTKIAPPLNPTKLQLDTFPNKNLGVNGTGQRKIVTTFKLANATEVPLIQNITIGKNETEDYDDVDIDEDSAAFNETLSKHNITQSKEDNHLYYNSTITTDPELGPSYWVNLTNRPDTKIDELLSRSHRRAATVQLSFEFPFYGHLIKNVTIATGGFLYTGDYVHSWLAATQYIAPLMANFDTSISNDSFIRHSDNGSAFTVEWERVSLQDKPDEGEFTFQTTLHKNGDIVFVYRNIPLVIKDIEDDHHPVKVGLSDAYIIDRTIFLVRRKTIYEYHRINFYKEDIKNWTVIYLTALPTCLQSGDCTSCTTKNVPSSKCYWCPSLNRCSSGIDRNRQDWLTQNCARKQLEDESMCSHISGADIFDNSNITYIHDANEFQHQLQGYSTASSRVYNNPNALGSNQPVQMGVSSIVAILFLIAMVSGLTLWVLYAYRNPHTTSGQMLIRYRPSQWRWRRGEARYTAATIHM